MTSQGTSSNRNGKMLEKEVKDTLDKMGLCFEQQIKRYPGPNPKGHVHDFVVSTSKGPVVLECKHFSGMSGTIWQKIPYAISVLSRHGVKSMVVLGGKAPTDWRLDLLKSTGEAMGVKVINVTELENHLG
jgi:hypothetical protein